MVVYRGKDIKSAAMNLLTTIKINQQPPRRLVPKTALGKWLWILGCIVVLVPMVMVGLLLTAVAIVAVLVLGLLSLMIIVIRRIGQKPNPEGKPSPEARRWTRDDGRRNVRIVQRTNADG
jgi:hypothetical protein